MDGFNPAGSVRFYLHLHGYKLINSLEELRRSLHLNLEQADYRTIDKNLSPNSLSIRISKITHVTAELHPQYTENYNWGFVCDVYSDIVYIDKDVFVHRLKSSWYTVVECDMRRTVVQLPNEFRRQTTWNNTPIMVLDGLCDGAEVKVSLMLGDTMPEDNPASLWHRIQQVFGLK